MRAKRYEGSTMKDALDRVREELGPDAVILEARQSRGRGLGALLSILGFRRAPVFEVLAAVDGNAEPRDFNSSPAAAAATAAAQPGHAAEAGPAARPADAAKPAPERVFQAITWVPSPLATNANADEAVVPVPAPTPVPAPIPAPVRMRVPSEPLGVLGTLRALEREAAVRARAAGLSAEMADLYAHLVDEDVAEDVAFAIVHQVDTADASQRETDQFREWAGEHAAGLVAVSGPIRMVRGRRKVVAFIGPTGVGKTTTIAKIAACFALFAKARVALVTADTYRIAAIEQIKSYAEIIGIPCEVVHSPRDMEQTLAELADYELVLIDTAGRSPNSPTRMYELKNMIDSAMPEEIHLVLSSTTRRRDLDNLIDRFEVVGFDRVILTKLDESMTFGAVFNVHAKCARPFSYFTNGQSVPEDIEAATQPAVAEMILSKWRMAGGL